MPFRPPIQFRIRDFHTSAILHQNDAKVNRFVGVRDDAKVIVFDEARCVSRLWALQKYGVLRTAGVLDISDGNAET